MPAPGHRRDRSDLDDRFERESELGAVMDPLEFQVAERPAERINVGAAERWASCVAGGALAWYGLRRPSQILRWPKLALGLAGASLVYRGMSGRCELYRGLGINTARAPSPSAGVRARHGCKVEKSITVQRPAGDLYRWWRQLDQLPQVMRHVASVKEIDERHSHWTARGPFGATIEWDAQIINEREPEMIAWRSLPGSQVDTAGSIHFKTLPADRGTEVTVSVKYDPPGGKLTAAVAEFLGAGLDERIQQDLRRWKQLIETGEISTIEGQPRGS
jgi:uncharacterized membrane protein